MNKQYLICFGKDGEVELFKGDGSKGEIIKFFKDSCIKVTEIEMFNWIETAHNNNIKLSIYQISKVCSFF